MRVLSIVHDPSGTGVFGEAIAARGHEEIEWRIDADPEPRERFDALLVFGGSMNTHEEEMHPWLRDESALIERALAEAVPVLGICLGGQLVAKALGARVILSPEPEIGWYEVVRTPAAVADPLVGALPERFHSLQWHYYSFALPDGAVPLLESRACLQGYRAGSAWGVQFHPEVTREILQEWIGYSRRQGFDQVDLDAFEMESDRRIERWNEIGRSICSGFLDVAESRRR